MGAKDKAAEYCLAGIDHWSTCLERNEWAAWTQAVFSVLAIIAAVWVARRAERKQLQDARNHEAVALEKRAVMLARAGRAQTDLINYRLALDGDESIDNHGHDKARSDAIIVQRVIDYFRSTELRDYVSATELEIVNAVLDQLEQFLKDYGGAGSKGIEDLVKLKDGTDLIKTAVGYLKESAEDIRSGCSSDYTWEDIVDHNMVFPGGGFEVPRDKRDYPFFMY